MDELVYRLSGLSSNENTPAKQLPIKKAKDDCSPAKKKNDEGYVMRCVFSFLAGGVKTYLF